MDQNLSIYFSHSSFLWPKEYLCIQEKKKDVYLYFPHTHKNNI